MPVVETLSIDTPGHPEVCFMLDHVFAREQTVQGRQGVKRRRKVTNFFRDRKESRDLPTRHRRHEAAMATTTPRVRESLQLLFACITSPSRGTTAVRWARSARYGGPHRIPARPEWPFILDIQKNPVTYFCVLVLESLNKDGHRLHAGFLSSSDQTATA